MTNDRDIRRDIERDERWLAELLAGGRGPSAVTIEHVRGAIAIELDRMVLSSASDPVPDQAVIAEVRGAVRRALRGRTVFGIPSRVKQVLGAVAAAASLLAAAGLVRFAVPPGASKPVTYLAEAGGTKPKAARAEHVKQVVEDLTSAFQSSLEHQNAALSLLAEDVNQLTKPTQETEIDAIEDDLNAIGDEIETLSVDPEGLLDT